MLEVVSMVDTINSQILFFLNLIMLMMLAALFFGLHAVTAIAITAVPVMLTILVYLTLPDDRKGS